MFWRENDISQETGRNNLFVQTDAPHILKNGFGRSGKKSEREYYLPGDC
jgi:hypothetical protein